MSLIFPKSLSMKNEHLIPLLNLMLLSRASDKRQAIMVRQGKAHIHVSSSGHEALMALTYLLSLDDYLYPYYRGSHLMIGKGLSCEALAQDFLAKSTSSSQGRSMSTHCGSTNLRIFPSAAPTASQCLPAVGTAWGQKLLGQSSIVVCSIGDGATREGDFYEAVCYAIQNKLPIIFLIEDNHYAISTPTEKLLPFRMGIFNDSIVTKVNGRDLFAIYEIAEKSILKARTSQGPSILWAEVDRLDSHTVGENHELYRSQNELSAMQDPILLYKKQLISMGKLTEEEFTALEQAAHEKVAALYKLIEKDPNPEPINLQQHLYGPVVEHSPLPLFSDNTLNTMVEGLNCILDHGLNTYSNMLLFGQDIEDPKGGVFGFTRNLSKKYPGRVLNAPIAESTIIGTAVGLSVLGFRPVFEIQFIDFITPGFDQLVSQVASLRWRSCSQWSCPLVLYAPYGAYLPAGGLWHSQSNDGWWSHIPGLRVAIPSTPQDVIDLFWAAFQDEDPSLILIPKHIFRKKMLLSNDSRATFGKARICKAGNDVTIVAWGNTVELAEEAAKIAEKKGISIEVLDLRTLVPCDWGSIEKSVAKTGRLVVVHEDNRTCGFGGTVITEIVSSPRFFNCLYSAPQLVARNDIHIPFHPDLEFAVLPNIDNILTAIYTVVQ